MIQLQLHKGTLKYTKEEKDLAKQMFFYSASGYSRMRKAGLNLPSESCVRNWISETEIRPGFCEEIFSKIREKLSKLPSSQTVCCLKFDEMSIKQFEEYSQKYDIIEGLIDLGPLGRSNEPTVNVLLFCLDSINAENPWRQIVAYFLTGKKSTHKEIVQLTEICLEKLKNVGANVKLITCDQGGPNRKAFSNWKISPHRVRLPSLDRCFH
ncbi:THAP domain-containing protein [Ooceraea biroi]|uniref:THAP domain-containing protein n=1 Tax=Ooceraea biroi TaxID=2015173 RepID=A0A026VVY0_OOCBI|nr:THAP domain-containing protein [Ooceraea biroi]